MAHGARGTTCNQRGSPPKAKTILRCIWQTWCNKAEHPNYKYLNGIATFVKLHANDANEDYIPRQTITITKNCRHINQDDFTLLQYCLFPSVTFKDEQLTPSLWDRYIIVLQNLIFATNINARKQLKDIKIEKLKEADTNEERQKINEEYQRSDEEFITSFKSKYSDPYPPSWMTMEITSFGTLSILYNNLQPGRAKRDIAAYFKLADTVFASWLHCIVYIRNICAHHSRLWNRVLSVRPLMPRKPRKPFIALPASGTQQVYFVLCMIIYLLDTINPNHSFIARFKDLLHRYPLIDVSAMGFPADWENERLWQQSSEKLIHS